MTNSKMAKIGGWSLIAFTLIYLGLQLLFILVYNYRAAPHGPDIDTFKMLLAGGTTLQALLSIFALLPLLIIPASVGAYYAFRDVSEPGLRVSVLFAVIAAFSLMLCLARYPTFDWYLARFYAGGHGGEAMTGAVFHALDDYLGLFVGGVIGLVCAAIWFFIVSASMIHTRDLKWVGYLGILAGIYLLVTLIEPFKLLPEGAQRYLNILSPIEFLWLMSFGVCLLFYKDVRGV